MNKDNTADFGKCESILWNNIPHSFQSLSRGVHLFHSGDRLKSIYQLRSGALKGYIVSEDGVEQIIDFHAAGEIIGLDSIYTRRCQSNVVALKASSVAVISLDEIVKASQRSVHLYQQIMKGVSADMLRRKRRKLYIAGKCAEQRLASFFLDQARQASVRGENVAYFRLAMTQADVGRFLGMSVETVSRIIHRFKQRGWLTMERKRIHLLDLDALKRLVQCVGDESKVINRSCEVRSVMGRV